MCSLYSLLITTAPKAACGEAQKPSAAKQLAQLDLSKILQSALALLFTYKKNILHTPRHTMPNDASYGA